MCFVSLVDVDGRHEAALGYLVIDEEGHVGLRLPHATQFNGGRHRHGGENVQLSTVAMGDLYLIEQVPDELTPHTEVMWRANTFLIGRSDGDTPLTAVVAHD